MRNKDTGEFELVVGNGQLVGGFFIVILLFGVGTAIGYILGQNSAEKAAKAQGEATPCVATDSRPQPSQPATAIQTETAKPAQATPTPAETTQPAPQTTAQAKEPEPAPTTRPARTEPTRSEAKKEPPPKKEAPAASETVQVPYGFFWQVTASANQEAVRATVKTLKDRGFPASTAPGPNNLIRVLVGPYSDIQAKAKAKSELEAMSFKTFPYTHERE